MRGQHTPGTTSPRSMARVLAAVLLLCLVAASDLLPPQTVAQDSPRSRRGRQRRGQVEALARQAIQIHNHGVDEYGRGNLALAVALCNQALKIDPYYVDAYNTRGAAYDDLGEKEKAVADYTRAIELQPGNSMAYNNRSCAYMDMKKYDLALADCDRLVKMTPRRGGVRLRRARILLQLKQDEAALADYEAALRLGRSLDAAEKSEAQNKCQELKAALTAAKGAPVAAKISGRSSAASVAASAAASAGSTAIVVSPSQRQATVGITQQGTGINFGAWLWHLFQGNLAFAVRNWAAAARSYAEAGLANPGDPFARLRMGNALSRSGDVEGARTAYYKALAVHQRFWPAAKKLYGLNYR